MDEDDGELGWHVKCVSGPEKVEEILNYLPSSAQNIQVVALEGRVLLVYLIPYADQRQDKGVWLAHHSDWSGFGVFGTEIEAMRYGNENYMRVVFLPFGGDVRTRAEERG